MGVRGQIPWNKGKKLGFVPVGAFKKGHKPSLKAVEITRARIGSKHPRWVGGRKVSSKKYRQKNKNRILYYNKQRRNRKLNAHGSHTFGEWETLKAQYGFTCPACKRKEPEIKLTEDHIIPLTKGGSDFIENIQPLCQSCNSRKNNKIIRYI